MAIFQTVTTSFKVEILQAVHNFGPTSPDTFKIALYTGNASLDAATTVYTTLNEVTGTGYVAGGVTLVISQSPTAANNNQQVPTAYVSFNPALWTGATFIARGALIYNSSKGNKSVATLDFGSDKTVNNQTLTVTFPVADPNNAIVRIS
jgi:hypothetical protein